MKHFIIFSIVSLLTVGTASSQKISSAFFDHVDQFLSSQVDNGLLDYGTLKSNTQLSAIMKMINTADVSSLDEQSAKAFYINAYNLHVINEIVKAYPIESTQDVNGFFDRKKVEVANEKMTLNNLEKKKLLNVYNDGRLHFVLVCGAHGCPPITTFAYKPELLEQQLESQTKLALNDPNFIRVNGNKTELSEIFDWYASDFGGSKSNTIDYINRYRKSPIDKSTKISYYTYDWTVNDVSTGTVGNVGAITTKGNNASRYIVSSTVPKGTTESKIFNNLYTQRTGSGGELTDRATFFTTTYTFLYGVTDRFNLGVNARYRRVRNDVASSSAFSVLGNSDAISTRQGLTAIGPQIRFAPVKEWSNFSIQSSFVFAIGDNLKGSDGTEPFIDWDGATWWTQIFNDFSIGNNFSLFTELDFLIEDIGRSSTGHINRFSTPVTAIFSYNPTPKTTIYALSGFSPFWQSDFDYFYQYGVGVKYQFTPNIELELLYTDFTNEFLSNTGGQASTYNVGYRINF